MIKATGICIQPPTMTKKDFKDYDKSFFEGYWSEELEVKNEI